MTTYSGGCHCGKVRYQVTLDLGKVISCNCSMCGKKGSLLTFAPAEQFKLQSGEGDLTVLTARLRQNRISGRDQPEHGQHRDD